MEELRRIIFSEEELLCAFRSFARKDPTSLPPEDIHSCEPFEDSEFGCILKVTTGISPQNPEGNEIIFNAADVLPRLILFCLENNIMLPRCGQKTFEIFNSCASLLVRLNLEFDLSHGDEPMHSEDLNL